MGYNPRMLRYVILAHDHPFSHWDFLLERQPGGALRSWRLLEEPVAGSCCPAEALPDHRRLYLDYEGPVSGDRGVVAQVDAGTYAPAADSGPEWRIRLSGRRGLAAARLMRTAAGEVWQFD